MRDLKKYLCVWVNFFMMLESSGSIQQKGLQEIVKTSAQSYISFPSEGSVHKSYKKKDDKQTTEVKKNSKEQQSIILHDVAMFLDVSEQQPQAIANASLLALCQNGWSELGYPVVLTSSLLAVLFNHPDQQVQKMLMSLDDVFIIRKTKIGDFYLFVPKSYSKASLEKYAAMSSQLPEGADLLTFATGFNLSNLVPVFVRDIKKNVVNQAINIASLQSMFVQKKDEQSLGNEMLGMWNILLNGHGSYSHALKEHIEQGELIALTGLLDKELYQDAQIAGLPLQAYRDLLQFFVRNIRVNFLYYSTCYAGGYNTVLPYVEGLIGRYVIEGSAEEQKVVQRFAKPDFIVVAAALGDTVTYGLAKIHVDKCVACTIGSSLQTGNVCMSDAADRSKNTGAINFPLFFDRLHKYARTDRLAATLLNNTQLRDVLSPLSIVSKGFHSLLKGVPQVMFPNTDMFKVVDIEGNLCVITNVAAQVYKKENKSIVANDKDAIVLYPVHISAPLRIIGKTVPAIVSMLPFVGMHVIDHIVYADLTFKDLVKSMSSYTPVFDRYFFIKKVTLLGDDGAEIIYKNMLVRVRDGLLGIVYTDLAQNIYTYRAQGTVLVEGAIKKQGSIIESYDDSTIMSRYFSYQPIRSLFNYSGLFRHMLSLEEKIYPYTSDQLTILTKKYSEFADLIKSPHQVKKGGVYAALANAAYDGDIQAADILIKLGADINQQAQEGGRTPLMQAVLKNNADMAAFLLKNGADEFIKDSYGKTALDMISPTDSQTNALFKVLAEYEKLFPNLRYSMNDTSGFFTPLGVAAIKGDLVAARVLIALGADVNVSPEKSKLTPLMQAVSKNNKNMVQFLLEKGANTTLKNRAGKTAKDLASPDQLEIYKLLAQ
jgi:hypothetical protein